MTFYCPFCPKPRAFKVMSSLKKHFMRSHSDGKCPACGEKYKSLPSHSMYVYTRTGCEKHAVVWYLSTRNLSKNIPDDVKSKVLKICEEILSRKDGWKSVGENKKVQIRSYSRWTAEEIEFLKENYGKMSAKQIGDAIGRSKSSVIHKVKELREMGVMD